ncbi:uncharacterized protein LOC142523782 [Primulina tabacum]|uniref:uncharacterized protein LOC142523782 n=1 Tax=Primulina tabacum TaxID=48773 RepID=UPI003F5926CB
MKITQSFTSVSYPQANGQTYVTNRVIVQSLKARFQGVCKDWVEEIPSVLWAYRTIHWTATKETPYSLVYGSETVLPVEIGQELAFIEGKRERVVIQMEAYRRRVKRGYNQKVRPREFQVGDLVLKKANPAGEVGNLKAWWEGKNKKD